MAVGDDSTGELMSRRAIHVFLAICGLVGGGLWLTSTSTVRRWDGYFDLQVSLIRDECDSISSISFATLSASEWDEAIPSEVWLNEYEFRPVSDIASCHFTVPIPCSGEESGLFGYEVRYNEKSVLLLQVRDEKGGSIIQHISIPSGRGARAVRVVLQKKREKENSKGTEN
jgi:hypothetical protein